MPKFEPIPYHKATHLVVDIETLGITIPTPILSLGYVILDFANQVISPVTTGCIQFDPLQCAGHPETSTVLWWRQQSAAAQYAAFEQTPDANPLGMFENLFKCYRFDYLWGKSPDFDFGHMAAQLKAVSHDVPWNFWQLRDIRTVEGFGIEYQGLNPIFEELNFLAAQHETAHSALDDAIHEAQMLCGAVVQIAGL